MRALTIIILVSIFISLTIPQYSKYYYFQTTFVPLQSGHISKNKIVNQKSESHPLIFISSSGQNLLSHNLQSMRFLRGIFDNTSFVTCPKILSQRRFPDRIRYRVNKRRNLLLFCSSSTFKCFPTKQSRLGYHPISHNLQSARSLKEIFEQHKFCYYSQSPPSETISGSCVRHSVNKRRNLLFFVPHQISNVFLPSKPRDDTLEKKKKILFQGGIEIAGERKIKKSVQKKSKRYNYVHRK